MTITREQALDVLLSDLDPETRTLVEQILEAAPSSRVPDDMRKRLEDTAAANETALHALRLAVIGGAAVWIEDMIEAGVPEEEAYRFAAVVLEYGCALLVRRLYQKLDKPFSPGRFAIAACAQAVAASSFQMGMIDKDKADLEELKQVEEAAS
jgi:hypothetical protein